jgi:hypothetical protein
MTWGGFFGGQPFIAQDTGPSPPSGQGISDANLALPSNTTTHQGTITVDVDNLLLPTSIQLLSSAAASDTSGRWLPKIQPFLDVDNDSNFGEFPDDAVTSVGTTPGPLTAADDADFGIRIRPTGAPDVAYSALRDMVFNITTPSAVPVVLGQFSSTTENFEYASGWWDYWLHPTFTAEKLRERLEVAGGDNNNSSAVPSTYTAVPLGGGAYQITLTIPVLVNDPDTTAPTSFTGQLVATVVIPEPASVLLLGLGGMFMAVGCRRSRRK